LGEGAVAGGRLPLDLSAMSTEELVRLYEELGRDAPVAVTATGKDGSVIGVVARPDDMKNMIVIFGDARPAQAGVEVRLLDYEIRESKAGKKYVRAFLWVPSAGAEGLRSEIAREVKRRLAGLFPEGLRGLVEKILGGVVPEDEISGVDFVAHWEDPASLGVYVAVGVEGRLYEASSRPDLYPTGLKVYSARPVLRLEADAGGAEAVPIPGLRVYRVGGEVVAVPLTERAAKLVRAWLRLRELRLPEDLEEAVWGRVLERVKA